MDTPRIIAVADVHLTVPTETLSAVEVFYAQQLGFSRYGGSDGEYIEFRGYPRSGPRLVVKAMDQVVEKLPRRQAVIQVASLRELAEELTESGFEVVWSRGIFYHDRRVWVTDPGGNIIELVMQHAR